MAPSTTKTPAHLMPPTTPLPPVVHAVGGSVGSALAILVFYPLERIRVELQSQSSQTRTHAKTSTSVPCVQTSSEEDENGEKEADGNDENKISDPIKSACEKGIHVEKNEVEEQHSQHQDHQSHLPQHLVQSTNPLQRVVVQEPSSSSSSGEPSSSGNSSSTESSSVEIVFYPCRSTESSETSQQSEKSQQSHNSGGSKDSSYGVLSFGEGSSSKGESYHEVISGPGEIGEAGEKDESEAFARGEGAPLESQKSKEAQKEASGNRTTEPRHSTDFESIHGPSVTGLRAEALPVTDSTQKFILRAKQPDQNNNTDGFRKVAKKSSSVAIDSDQAKKVKSGDVGDFNDEKETILQCLLRLHQEKTLYQGASHMVTTLMISNFVFFYALQVTKRSLYQLHHSKLLDIERSRSQRGRLRDRPLSTNCSHSLTTISHLALNLFLPKSKMGTSLLASCLAGAINVLLTNPLWVASLRIMESKLPSSLDSNANQKMQRRHQTQQMHKKPSLWAVMYRIAKSEGILQLWNGTATSLLLVSNPAIQHFVYEQLKLLRLHYLTMDGTLTPFEAFMFGALAKTVATVVTYPLQLAQVLLRLQSKKLDSRQPQTSQPASSSTCNGPSEKHHRDIEPSQINDTQIIYRGMIHCLHQQLHKGGIPALFQGMNAKLLQTVLTAAFTFLTYEQTLVMVGKIYKAYRSYVMLNASRTKNRRLLQ